MINEMPLANYRTSFLPGNEPDNKEGISDRFVARDRKAIDNATIQNRLAQALERSTGFHFNIIFLESRTKLTSKYHEEAARYCLRNSIPLDGHITFVKNSSTGDPLSAWMILHTLGHALGDFDSNMVGRIRSIFSKMDAANRITSSTPDDVIANLAKVFKFRSLANKKVTSLEELVYELVAEYLWHGQIRANLVNFQVFSSVRAIEETIHEALSHAVGNIIIDLFDN